MSPKLAAIVPATNDPVTLDRCRAAIEAAFEAPEEVLVVEVPKGSGPAAARNAGALPAAGEVIVFVDADVAVHPDAFVRIRSAFDDDPELAAVFGSYDDTPDVRGVVAHFRNLLHHHVHQTSAGRVDTFWAGLGAIRRDAFEAVGGFDSAEYHVPSMEDVELGMRLAESGFKVRLDHELLATHLKEWRLLGMVRTDLVDRGVPWVALLLRRRQLSSSLNLSWRHRASALAVALGAGALVIRRPRPAALALAAQLLLNAHLYALLWRRRGPAEALAGVGLHAVHHLTAICAVPLGVVAFVRERRATEPGQAVPVAVAASDPTRSTAEPDLAAAG